MVKLWLNGVARRVLVDDFLPVDRQGNLLCSHTTAIAGNREDNAFEFWVPIIEKAYMKLCKLLGQTHRRYAICFEAFLSVLLTCGIVLRYAAF